jgi:hypothetical protein
MSERERVERLISERRDRIYKALKMHDFDLYRRCIQAAEAVSLNHHFYGKVAADIESAVVLMVADALKLEVKP